jgi:hypothetical protein
MATITGLCEDGGRPRGLTAVHTHADSSVSILPRADPGTVGVVTAAVAVAAIIAVGSHRRSADCSAVDASADRRARYRMISAISISATCISPSCIPPTGITTAGDADTASMNAAAVIASTPVAAAAPTRGRVFRDEAGAD